MARLSSIFFLIYFVAFLGLRFLIHSPGKPQGEEPVRSESDLLARSDRHDFKRLKLRGTVRHSGDYFWDLLFIPTYTLQTSGGLTLTIFAKGSPPAPDRDLELIGVFRQYYRGRYGCWLGVVEVERVYPEEKNFANQAP